MFLLLPFQTLFSQQDASTLSKKIPISVTSASGLELIETLESVYGIRLSFNGMGIDLSRPIVISESPIATADLLALIFEGYQYTLIENAEGKVLISFADVPVLPTVFTVRGKVYDKSSGEILIGAIISEQTTNTYAFTNEYGFYSLEVPIKNNALLFHSLGYDDATFADVSEPAMDVYMSFDNELPSVLISPTVSALYIKGLGGQRMKLDKSNPSLSVGGDNDVLELTKNLPGVQSGNEGQTGLYVRGGSPDQNLILLDGIPLYEVSHAVGLSSIFIDESIRDISFSKDGFPARYGGRLSSVLSVTLKEGSKKRLKGSVQLGATSGSFHLEGPIAKGHTSFSISGRKSFLNLYLNDIYTRFTEYDGIGVDFYDLTAKVSHNFSPTRKFTLSYYQGKDDFNLERNEAFEEDTDEFNTFTKNNVNWGTRLLNAQYSNIISDDFFFNIALGGSSYNFNSRSSYSFESRFDQILTLQEYDLRSLTEIVDYLAGINFDYFYNDRHRLKFGLNYTIHNYRPEIRQSDFVIDTIEGGVATDDILVPADEYGIYLEDTYTINEQWEMYMGFHLSGYIVGETAYRNLQPRFRLVYQPTRESRFDLAYTNTAQYVHLLINPGTGVPSDLWVPSTEQIKPQTADQLSMSYTKLFGRQFNFRVGGYLKQMSNVLEYQSPVDLVFSVINQTPAIDTTSWDQRVAVGTSFSRGLEFEGKYEDDKWQSWIAYTYSKTSRTFAELNAGDPFPYKYDRRNDLNMGVRYKFSDSFSAMAKWVYGDGNTFSLSLTEIVTIDGVTLINTGDRNNYQLPAFHHLDVQFDYNREYVSGNKLHLSVGVYNVYSRLNGFYIYIFENPLKGERFGRKVSIFPIMPQVSLSYSF